jgi:hypothetical protein
VGLVLSSRSNRIDPRFRLAVLISQMLAISMGAPASLWRGFLLPPIARLEILICTMRELIIRFIGFVLILILVFVGFELFKKFLIAKRPSLKPHFEGQAK